MREPHVFIVAGNHQVARGMAEVDLGLRPFEWRPILSYHDAIRLRGLEGPLRKPDSPYRVEFAYNASALRGFGDIVEELRASGFVAP